MNSSQFHLIVYRCGTDVESTPEDIGKPQYIIDLVWETGIDICLINCSSIQKQSGALISSKLIPPKVGSSSGVSLVIPAKAGIQEHI